MALRRIRSVTKGAYKPTQVAHCPPLAEAFGPGPQTPLSFRCTKPALSMLVRTCSASFAISGSAFRCAFSTFIFSKRASFSSIAYCLVIDASFSSSMVYLVFRRLDPIFIRWAPVPLDSKRKEGG